MTQNVVTKPLPLANNRAVIAAYKSYLHGDNPARFRVGDQVTFEKCDEREWPLLILGIRGKQVDAICYDGMPHLVRVKMSTLNKLRVVRIQETGCETVNMYRGLVGLPGEDDE